MEYNYWFKAGDKIVCLDKTSIYNYEITKCVFTVKYCHDGMYCLALTEYSTGFFSANNVHANFHFYKGQLTNEEIEEWLK